jgi:hypothetical protein
LYVLHEHGVFVGQSPYSDITIKNSATLSTPALRSEILRMLAPNRRRLALLHSSPLQGYSLESGEQSVGGAGSLLFVIKHNKTGKIFGGYCEDERVKFDGLYAQWQYSRTNFLFRLNGDHPIKLVQSDCSLPTNVWGNLPAGHALDLIAMMDKAGFGRYLPQIFTVSADGYLPPVSLNSLTLAGVDHWYGCDVTCEVFSCM